mgnify:CR=1 FL=1
MRAYYMNEHGNDIFYEIETGGAKHLQMGIGFCYYNIKKYERRCGRKPGATFAQDMRKINDYKDELQRLWLIVLKYNSEVTK